MWQAVSRLLSEHLGSEEIREKTELAGGEIHPAWRVSYGDNPVFVKCDARELLPIFTAEADQLALLARSKTVRVPQVYGVGSDRDYSFLLLEYHPLKPLDA
ncbi:MAG: fructosamine kinase family protein, partial [Serratia liquefaciens]|nr:fructosamine kinase family protein [Serratia liquefaciens]